MSWFIIWKNLTNTINTSKFSFMRKTHVVNVQSSIKATNHLVPNMLEFDTGPQMSTFCIIRRICCTMVLNKLTYITFKWLRLIGFTILKLGTNLPCTSTQGTQQLTPLVKSVIRVDDLCVEHLSRWRKSLQCVENIVVKIDISNSKPTYDHGRKKSWGLSNKNRKIECITAFSKLSATQPVHLLGWIDSVQIKSKPN